MSIQVRQIDLNQLYSFVTNSFSGQAFSGSFLDYVNNNGYMGSGILYTTGGNQTIYTDVIFSLSPALPYSGATGEAVARKYIDDLVFNKINDFSGYSNQNFIQSGANNVFTGVNLFTSNIFIPIATQANQGANLQNLLNASGVLQSGINNVIIFDVAYLGQTQHFTGLKIFDVNPLVSTPTGPSGVVNLDYLTGNFSVTNTVDLTNDQTISGIKTFVESPIIPIGISSNNPIQKQQLDAAITNVSIGTGSIQGVTTINGLSGIVMVAGTNGISTAICSGILYVSGNANNTNLLSFSFPLASGVTGVSYAYNSPFALKPNVVGNIEYLGQSSLQYFNGIIFSSTTTGFNVGFSTAIPSTGYNYNFSAIPVISGDYFFGLKGDPGQPQSSFNPKGMWQAGVLYNPYDVVFTQNNNVTYFTTGASISDSLNGPSGTGTTLWNILSSGMVGPSGFSRYQGIWNSGYNYTYGDSVSYNNSTYGLTNLISSGIIPSSLTGWTVLARSADIGYFINSGIITGNRVNISFFQSPVISGFDLAEAFVASDFFFTGFALATIQTGAGPQNGGILTGRIYSRDLNNNKNILQIFSFDSGVNSYISGNFSIPITGYSRIGLDITNSLSGIDKFSLGLFGFGF